MLKVIVALILLGAAVSFAADTATKTEEIAIAALLRERDSIEEAETQLDKRKQAWQAAYAAVLSDVCTRLKMKPGTRLDFNKGQWSVAAVRS